MTLKAAYCKHTLIFKFDAGTSRGVLKTRDVYFIKLFNQENPEYFGLGESAPLSGLSVDFRPNIEEFIANWVTNFNHSEVSLSDFPDRLKQPELEKWPSIVFALEMAFLDLTNGAKAILYQNDFSTGKSEIEINGLIWMGSEKFMAEQIEQKLKSGFKTLKMKIGAIDFETEFKLLKSVRMHFSEQDLTLRVDANGAFKAQEVRPVLDRLSSLDLHSIEQPIRANHWEQMAELCEKTPVPIALDEELIGIGKFRQKTLLSAIKPQFLIFKPTLLGGFAATQNWIDLANEQNIGWWMTSALESNVGLNAISQFTFKSQNKLPQGLGTGQLYENNIISPLEIKKGRIRYNNTVNWDYSLLKFRD